MKTYEFEQHEDYATLKVTMGESVHWVPVDSANSDYAEYLSFTAWVEDGNDPDEFWTQSAL